MAAKWHVKERSSPGVGAPGKWGKRSMCWGKWRTLGSYDSEAEAIEAASEAWARGGLKRWAVFYRGRIVWRSWGA